MQGLARAAERRAESPNRWEIDTATATADVQALADELGALVAARGTAIDGLPPASAPSVVVQTAGRAQAWYWLADQALWSCDSAARTACRAAALAPGESAALRQRLPAGAAQRGGPAAGPGAAPTAAPAASQPAQRDSR